MSHVELQLTINKLEARRYQQLKDRLASECPTARIVGAVRDAIMIDVDVEDQGRATLIVQEIFDVQ